MHLSIYILSILGLTPLPSQFVLVIGFFVYANGINIFISLSIL